VKNKVKENNEEMLALLFFIFWDERGL